MGTNIEIPPFVPPATQPPQTQTSTDIADAPKVVVVVQEPKQEDKVTPADTAQHTSAELPKFTEHTPTQPYYMDKK
jgi:hypothetical protein